MLARYLDKGANLLSGLDAIAYLGRIHWGAHVYIFFRINVYTRHWMLRRWGKPIAVQE